MMFMSGAVKKISEKEVEHVAALARIDISEEDKKLFTKQFNTILEYFEILSELDTDAVAPLPPVSTLTTAFRADTVKPSLTRDEALKNASKTERGFFKAPKIV